MKLKSFDQLSEIYSTQVANVDLLNEKKEKEVSNTLAKDTGPEAAEGFDKEIEECGCDKKEAKVEKQENETKKNKYIRKENFTMKLKFQELYEEAIQGTQQLAAQDPLAADAQALNLDANVAPVEGGEEEVELTPAELVAQIETLLAELKAKLPAEEAPVEGAAEAPVQKESYSARLAESIKRKKALARKEFLKKKAEKKEVVEEEAEVEIRGHPLHNQKDSGLCNPSNDKVGNLKKSSAKADTGDIDCEPEPEEADDFDKALTSVKGSRVVGSGKLTKSGAGAFD